MLGQKICNELGITCLAEQELHLRNGNGQANDALHGIRLTLVDKAVLFRTEVRHAKNQAANTRAWGKIQSADSVLSRYSMFYKKCCKAMIMLGADQELLGKYQVLLDGDLKVTTAVSNPNGSGSRNANLAWFWTMDISRDAKEDNWMSECKLSSPYLKLASQPTDYLVYRVNWFHAKAAQDRWDEEIELLTAEFQWTIDFVTECRIIISNTAGTRIWHLIGCELPPKCGVWRDANSTPLFFQPRMASHNLFWCHHHVT